MKRYLGAATFLLLAGCLTTEPITVTLPFDLHVVGQDWTPGVANVPADRFAEVNLVEGYRALPVSVSTTQNGLYLAGTNVTGELLLYEQKRFTGLAPNSTFTAALAVEYVTDIHSGCTTGVGASTFIKAGATLLALSQAPDAQGILRLTHDLGDATTGGDFTRLGDIRNGLSGCPSPGTFAVRGTVTQTQRVTVTTDIDGGFVLFVAVDSRALGRVEIYFTAILLILT
jgi:hypothetical protein